MINTQAIGGLAVAGGTIQAFLFAVSTIFSSQDDHEARAALRHLSIAQLYYEEVEGKGRVVQQIASGSGEIIPADWAARIERKRPDGSNGILCEGEGDGNYNGKVDVWSLDDWTDDDCPDLAQIGDVFEVSWTYENGFGFVESVGGQFELLADGTLELME